MKKIIAVIAVLATIFSLSACRAKTPEALAAKLAAKQEKEVQQSIKAEEEYRKGMDKYVEKLGKTEKGKKLVVKEPSGVDPEYMVYEFDKDEVLKKRYKCIFFTSPDDYELRLGYGDGVMRELVDHDDKARMLKYEIEFEADPQLTFDFFYNNFTSEAAVAEGCEVIE